MRLGIAEILEQASKLTKKDEKIDFLRKNYSTALATVLKYALDPNIVWALPDGDPPYKKNPYTDQETMLYSEARRLYLFIEGGNPNLTNMKREMLFIGLLESIAQKDAELILAAKNKKIPYKGITANLIEEAFPGLI